MNGQKYDWQNIFYIFLNICWWWLQELILGKNDQSSAENEINITWWCVNIACPLHVPVQKKPKTNPRMIFWIIKKEYRINSRFWITEAKDQVAHDQYIEITIFFKYLALLVEWNSEYDVWNENLISFPIVLKFIYLIKVGFMSLLGLKL